MPAERLPYRALYTEATNSWVKLRDGQATAWSRNMKTLTAPLSKLGRHRLPGWGPRDQSNRWLETLSEMAIRTPDKGPVRAADNTDKRGVNTLSEQQSLMTSKGLGTLQLWDGSSCEVDSLTLARDGGILDWDDRVIDVLDDREMQTFEFTDGQRDQLIDAMGIYDVDQLIPNICETELLVQ
ncbi:uncharacterized protein DEA37_0013681 [Paragonimus westermani]|uniref:Par3/HAL N-terminal domain-containing protein n=1 Tax=Paragonimus westermani TaxID=34504 RepID=A0A5J4P2Q4_9TREM|nr:uncharacterized protein DEA37_0013681 [Paragonimus westermani]